MIGYDKGKHRRTELSPRHQCTPQGPPINDAILSTRVAETCPGIQGNSDFYGLGIRIGIYLQWVSSWISNFFNPGKATANHDANTIFLIAVLTAISVSSANGDLMLVEQYIMLLLSYGFVFTVLSFIGLRLHFLQPKTLATFWRELATFCRELADTRGGMGKRGSKVFIFALKPLSWFKHPSLSWAGVFVRAMNGSWLAGLSIFTWMNYSTHLSSNDDDLCVPTLYFFGSRGLSRNLLLLFRVMACLAAAPAVYVFILCCGLAYVLYVSTNQWAIKYYVISLVDKLVEDGWDSLSSEKKIAIGTVIENPGLFSTVFAIAVFAPKLRGMSYLRVLQKKFHRHGSILKFNSRLQPSNRIKQKVLPEHAIVTAGISILQISTLLQKYNRESCHSLYVRLKSATMTTTTTKMETYWRSKSEIPDSHIHRLSILKSYSTFITGLSYLWHLYILAAMAVFILFIENTIIVAHVSGVHTIGTTGQLIPFIIGVASALLTARDLVMLRVSKVCSFPGCFRLLSLRHTYSIGRSTRKLAAVTSTSASTCLEFESAFVQIPRLTLRTN